MNVPIEPDGGMTIVDGVSAPGDHVELLAEMDVLCVISNCPQINNPCNGFNPDAGPGADLGGGRQPALADETAPLAAEILSICLTIFAKDKENSILVSVTPCDICPSGASLTPCSAESSSPTGARSPSGSSARSPSGHRLGRRLFRRRPLHPAPRAGHQRRPPRPRAGRRKLSRTSTPSSPPASRPAPRPSIPATASSPRTPPSPRPWRRTASPSSAPAPSICAPSA